MSISCGQQAHWMRSVILFIRGVFYETYSCLGHPSGGTLHIFVPCYQSEMSGWKPASSHRLACPDITCLSAAARARQRQLWERPWQAWLSFFVSCSHHRIGTVSLSFLGNRMQLCRWSWLALLPSHFWLQPLDYAYDDLSAPQVSFSRHANKSWRCRGFVFPHITYLQEI